MANSRSSTRKAAKARAQTAAVVAVAEPASNGAATTMVENWFRGLPLKAKVALVAVDCLHMSDHPLEDTVRELVSDFKDEVQAEVADPSGKLTGIDLAMGGLAVGAVAMEENEN